MGKGGPNDMYNNDGSRASYEVWMDWIDDICSEDFKERLKKDRLKSITRDVRKEYKDGV